MSDLEENLKPLDTLFWRNIISSLIYIRCPDEIKSLKKAKYHINSQDDGIFAVCYLDHRNGISFEVLATAHLSESEIIISRINNRTPKVYRMESFLKNDALTQDFFEKETIKFQDKLSSITDAYNYDYQEAIETRKITELDPFRFNQFPDDIKILIIGKKITTEEIWVRANHMEGTTIFGELLNEPNQDIGLHCGDVISFNLIKNKESIIQPVHFLDK